LAYLKFTYSITVNEAEIESNHSIIIRNLLSEYHTEIFISVADSLVQINSSHLNNQNCFRAFTSKGNLLMLDNFTHLQETNKAQCSLFLSQIFARLSTTISLPRFYYDLQPNVSISALISENSRSATKHAKQRDTLIVFTTCNQLKMTVLSLEFLSFSQPNADVIIVDDHSIGFNFYATVINL